MPSASETLRRVRFPAYFIAGIVSLTPLLEVAVSAWPYRIHDPNWRIALITTGVSASTIFLLSLLLIYLVGVFAEDRWVIWLVAVLSASAVLCCVVGSAAFVLDILQLRGQVRPGRESQYTLQSGWALAKIFLLAVGAGALSHNALRNARSVRRASDRHGRPPSPIIISSSTPVASGPNTLP